MHKEFVDNIKTLIESQQLLAQQACVEYSSIVNQIIASQTKDVKQIEHTLDYMLSFCFDDKMLQLYRKLCRYLWDIDKESTAYYVNADREMWDDENSKENI